MRLHMKIRSDTSATEREALLRRIENEAGEVKRMFPHQEDELSDLYVVTVADDEAVGIIKELQGSPAVDWIEEEPERHLIW
jgi:DNA polymerase II small subunit/DNA polymerase delta subunit B